MILPALLPTAIPSPLAEILAAEDLRGAIVGAVVTELDGRVRFAQNAEVRLNPASNQKLFTVAYALDRLGPDYRATTRFWAEDDRIVIASDGTLDLSYRDLKAIADGLGRRPRVALRQSYRVGRPGTWEMDDAPNRYAPAIAAFACEKGGVELWAGADGTPEFRPAPLGATISPVASPGASPERSPGAQPIAAGLTYDPFSGVVTIPEGRTLKPGRVDTLSQPASDLAAARLFGDEVTPLAGSVPARSPEATLLTDPLIVVAPRCLQPSDNFLAESLFEMAKVAGKSPEDWAFERVGIPRGGYSPEDGSGLSRQDLVTPSAVARLLRWTGRQGWGPGYRLALARPGIGTLRSRLAGVPFEGKTGSLAGVSSLSGFVRLKGGRTLTLSLLVNHYACSTTRVHALQDAFVRAAAQLQ